MGGIGEEWDEYHLTPAGWVKGDSYPFGTNAASPADRVLTYRETETMPNLVVSRWTSVRFGSVDDPQAKKLLAKYGHGPAGEPSKHK